MKFTKNRAARPFKTSAFHLLYKLPYRAWKAWRLRKQTQKILSQLSAAQLKDIGLSCDEVRHYK